MSGVAREAIEDEALLGIVGSKALLDQIDHQLVGHKLASIHVLLGLNSQLGTTLDGSTKQVARGDVSDAKLGNKSLSLRALTGTGCSQKYEIHEMLLLRVI